VTRRPAELECAGVVVSAAGRPVLRGVDLTVAAGSRTALVGPSGAGKTTLLRAIAGLAPLDAGEIRIGARPLDGVPAHRRRVAVVFQEPRLLPHLSVCENVALPLKAAGLPRRERRDRACELLADVGLRGFADRRVPGLSGGEQQRVALARALCADPELLLLDEPLAAVDPNRRAGLRRRIVELQRERRVTTLAITHDRTEAAELGEQVALMLEGWVVQHAPAHELFERPTSAAVARFFGMSNLLRGEVRDGRLEIAGAGVPVPGPDGPATFAIRPEHVVLAAEAPLMATVVEAAYAGTHVRLVVAAGEHRLEVHTTAEGLPPVGAEVGVELPLGRLWRLPATATQPARGGPERHADRP
jgi:ABC-type Fe3+/spermidine/putrescine transport system ATPase subunit